MSTYSEEDLATLTDEERAVILEDDGAAEANRKALAAIAEGADDDEEDDDTDDSDEDSNDSDDAGAAESAREVVQTKQAETDPEPEVKRSATLYEAQMPAEFKYSLDQVDQYENELRDKFKNGDIDFDEFERQRKWAETYRREYAKAETKVEIARDMQAQQVSKDWEFEVKTFVRAAAKDFGIDYKNDETKRNDLDGFIKILAGNPANDNKEMAWFLEEANKRVMALHGISAPSAKAEKKADPVKDRRPAIDNLPKSLAQVPGGDGPGDVGDEFAHIDKLSGDKLEAAIAAMSPAQRERYMTGS